MLHLRCAEFLFLACDVCVISDLVFCSPRSIHSYFGVQDLRQSVSRSQLRGRGIAVRSRPQRLTRDLRSAADQTARGPLTVTVTLAPVQDAPLSRGALAQALLLT